MHELNDTELGALRSVRGPEVEMSDAELIRGRARLEREITAAVTGERAAASGAGSPRAAQPLRTRRARSWGVLVAGLAAVTAVIVAATVLSPSAPSSRAQAAEILNRAAEQIRIEAAEVGPGQYLRIVREDVYGNQYGNELNPAEIVNYRTSEVFATYVPSDREDDWIMRRTGRRFVEMISPLNDPNVEAAVREETERIRADFAAHGILDEIAPGGRIPVEGYDPGTTARLEAAAEARFRDAPRDPVALRAYILEDVGEKDISDEAAIFEWDRDLLRDPSQDPALRAAYFEVLASLDAAEVAPRSGARPDPKTVVLRIDFADEMRGITELEFDSETGTLLSMRDVGLDGEVFGSSGIVAISVVDSVPSFDQETW